MNNIVILENNLAWLNHFINYFPKDDNCKLYFVTDDRNFQLENQILEMLNSQNKFSDFEFMKVSDIMKEYYDILNDSGKFFMENCTYHIKLFLIGYFAEKQDKCLFLDDDCVIIKETNSLFLNHENAFLSVGMLNGLNSLELFHTLNNVFESKASLEEYNKNILNGGVAIISKDETLKYKVAKYANSYFICNWIHRSKQTSCADERFLTYYRLSVNGDSFTNKEVRIVSIREDFKGNLKITPSIIHSYKEGSEKYFDRFFYDPERDMFINKCSKLYARHYKKEE